MNILKLGWWGNGKAVVISLSFSVPLLVLAIYDSKIKNYYYSCWDCVDKINFIESISFLFFSFLFFSLLFLFQKNKAKFEKWRRFSSWYLVVNTIIIVTTPEYAGDTYINIQRSVVVLILTGLHFVISWFYLLRKND